MATQLQHPEPELLVQEKENHSEVEVNNAQTNKPKLEATPAQVQEKPSALDGLKQHKKPLFIIGAIVVLVAGAFAWMYFSSL